MQLLAVQPKQAFYISCVGLALIIAPLSSFAITVEEVPNPRQANRG